MTSQYILIVYIIKYSDIYKIIMYLVTTITINIVNIYNIYNDIFSLIYIKY